MMFRLCLIMNESNSFIELIKIISFHTHSSWSCRYISNKRSEITLSIFYWKCHKMEKSSISLGSLFQWRMLLQRRNGSETQEKQQDLSKNHPKKISKEDYNKWSCEEIIRVLALAFVSPWSHNSFQIYSLLKNGLRKFFIKSREK